MTTLTARIEAARAARPAPPEPKRYPNLVRDCTCRTLFVCKHGN